ADRRQDDHERRVPRRPRKDEDVRRPDLRHREEIREQAVVPLHGTVAAVQLREDPAEAGESGKIAVERLSCSAVQLNSSTAQQLNSSMAFLIDDILFAPFTGP